MQDLEYRTMRSWLRGAHMSFAWAGCNRVGHGVTEEGTWGSKINGLLVRKSGGAGGALWAKKNPAGVSLRGVVNGLD